VRLVAPGAIDLISHEWALGFDCNGKFERRKLYSYMKSVELDCVRANGFWFWW
jgi:hypothetical protein